MRKKKPLLVGIVIGMVARPVVVQLYRPFHHKVRAKIYNLAFDFVQSFDANNS